MKITEFRDYYKGQRPELAEGTMRLHLDAFRVLLKHFGDVDLGSIKPRGVGEFRTALATIRFQSEATTRRHIATARAIWAWAVRRELCKTNPFVGERLGPPPAQENWDYVALGKIKEVVKACDNPLGWRESWGTQADWKRAILLARLAGLRLNEIQRADSSWLDHSNRTINVQPAARSDGTVRKSTKMSFRRVPCCPQLWDALKDAQGPLCAGLGKTPHRTIRWLRLMDGNIPWTKPFHTLRKSLETDWLDDPTMNVMDVCKWLGHSPMVAMRHYQKTKPESLARVTGQVPVTA